MTSTSYASEMIVGLQDEESGGQAFSELDSIKCVRLEQFRSLRLSVGYEQRLRSGEYQGCSSGEVLASLKTDRSAQFRVLTRYSCATLSGGLRVDADDCETVRADASAAFSTNLEATESWPVQCSTDTKVVVGFYYSSSSTPVYMGIKCCDIKPSER
ncbi:uncharacterized protein LOC119106460 [Pollicipes pollicipes]|uniref:uncharacterized protein LOC119106460 n=1 Tax=Pollicipes pollicipes TaxID=41117 RepID=UPI0018856781|nr:uncharacterized protein LOC119106460 [Pollicipes pollicipes]